MSAVEEHKPVEKRRALGRGLDSLLPSGPRMVPAAPTSAAGAATARTGMSEPHGAAAVRPPVIPAAVPEIVPPTSSAVTGEIAEIHAGREKTPTRAEAPAPHEIVEIPLDLIDENPYQTRRTFDAAALNELAESIKANGLAQPVVVRAGTNGRYVLVLGERRCRASKLAGKASVAAIVRQLGNEQAAEMTIVENLQRQDLNCLEQAQAFARLSQEFNLTQEQIGKRTGTSRESVANYMRLLKLPKAVLDLVGEGKLGFSEARVLLEATPYLEPAGIEEMAQNAIRLDWTVKDLKAQVNLLQNPARYEAQPKDKKAVDPNVRDAERRLRESLGMRVRVMAYQGNKGQIVIRYESLADFDRVLERLAGDN
ncbi:MAG: chromosome partitioning protein ParB [Acidobacteria bacterium]|nr:MAG: chromosome partitioning protein ParB [Acidobacteriota bacterium]